jgi:hypothetical protein
MKGGDTDGEEESEKGCQESRQEGKEGQKGKKSQKGKKKIMPTT